MQLEAIQPLHDQNYLHGDIKSDNVMFITPIIDRKQVVRLAFIDFGLAVKLGVDNKITRISTSLAPGSIFMKDKYTKKSDVISIFYTAITVMDAAIKDRQKFELKVCGVCRTNIKLVFASTQ